jgi:hypothetical protein
MLKFTTQAKTIWTTLRQKHRSFLLTRSMGCALFCGWFVGAGASGFTLRRDFPAPAPTNTKSFGDDLPQQFASDANVVLRLVTDDGGRDAIQKRRAGR